MHTVDVVVVLDQCMRRQAGTEDRCHVRLGPPYDIDQRLPEWLIDEMWFDDVCARDDQRVEAFLSEILETEIVLRNMRPGRLAAIQPGQRERVDEELRNRVAAADKMDELPLGCLQRRIRHHVQEADVQLADVLVLRTVERQDDMAVVFSMRRTSAARCVRPAACTE